MIHFLKTSDHSSSVCDSLVESAAKFRQDGWVSTTIEGKSVALVFFNPSLRTRASMQVTIHELGGNPIVIEPGGTSWTLEHREGEVMDADKTEHLKEFVRVLERYVSAIGV